MSNPNKPDWVEDATDTEREAAEAWDVQDEDT